MNEQIVFLRLTQRGIGLISNNSNAKKMLQKSEFMS